MHARNPVLDTRVLDPVVSRMLGDAPTFFKEHWRKRSLYVPNACAECAGMYSIEKFLADMVETQRVPYVCVSTRDGERLFTKHTTAENLRNAVLAGGVSAIKLSKIWYGPIPESWTWMRALFGSLCRAVAMTYMTPARSEDVDLFLAGPQSGFGTHFDSTDVFTLQLYGERKWIVDDKVRFDSVLEVTRGRNWSLAKEIDFRGPTREFTLRPGDSLYVPVYSVHRVTGVSWSVSLSLGLRAFNEIDFVEHLLEAIRLTGYMNYSPVTSVPESFEELHTEAKLELMHRVRLLLEKMEGAALASLLGPLKIPQSLDTPTLTPNQAQRSRRKARS